MLAHGLFGTTYPVQSHSTGQHCWQHALGSRAGSSPACLPPALVLLTRCLFGIWNVCARRMSRLELPTSASNSPPTIDHPAPGSQMARSLGSKWKVMACLALCASHTRLKPRRTFGGSVAALGKRKYSCATSTPPRRPVLRRSNETKTTGLELRR